MFELPANAGMGMKPSDEHAVGLCARHHRALHQIGRRSFETLHGVDLATEAGRLAGTAPPTEETTMLDFAPTADPTLDLLRERAAELERISGENAARLEELREMIARATNRRLRAPRRLRTPEERIAAAREALPPAPVSTTLDNALARLGAAVAERDAEMETA